MTNNTLGEHVRRFLSVKYNPETRTWYAKYLAPMVEFFGTSCEPDSIDREDAEAYWQTVQRRRKCWAGHPYRPSENRRLSPSTLHNYLRATRTLWNHMVRQQVVLYNPFDHLKAPRDSRPVQMKAISPEDLNAIWETARKSSRRDHAIVTVVATTGLRAGELISMSLERLDLKTGVAWVHGKRGWRKIFLGETSVKALKAYLRERQLTRHGPLWLNVYDEPLTGDGVRQLVDRLAKRAGVTGRHNLHSFRHRAAQAWLDSGVNAEIVAQALGHADVNITLAIYGNQDERRVASAIRQVELTPFQREDGP